MRGNNLIVPSQFRKVYVYFVLKEVDGMITYDVGAELRQLRISRNLTQENVADIFNTTQRRISMIETNRIEVKAREYLEMKTVLSGIKKLATHQFEWRPKEGARI